MSNVSNLSPMISKLRVESVDQGRFWKIEYLSGSVTGGVLEPAYADVWSTTIIFSPCESVVKCSHC